MVSKITLAKALKSIFLSEEFCRMKYFNLFFCQFLLFFLSAQQRCFMEISSSKEFPKKYCRRIKVKLQSACNSIFTEKIKHCKKNRINILESRAANLLAFLMQLRNYIDFASLPNFALRVFFLNIYFMDEEF